MAKEFPDIITVRNRRVRKGAGMLSGLPFNAPAGEYRILGIDKSEEGLVRLSKGKLYAKILTIEPGMLAVVEPLEVVEVMDEVRR